jgi:hypothetical protein
LSRKHPGECRGSRKFQELDPGFRQDAVKENIRVLRDLRVSKKQKGYFMLPAIISQVGLPVLIGVIAAALKTIDSPAAKTATESLETVGASMKSGGISLEQIEEANRHAEKIAEIEQQQFQSALSEINQSARAELASADPYVRRMRPTFGYFMAITWAAQMLALAYVIVFETDKAGFVLQAMGSLSGIWAFGLSVLGIYVYKRSEEKKSAQAPDDMIFWSRQR